VGDGHQSGGLPGHHPARSATVIAPSLKWLRMSKPSTGYGWNALTFELHKAYIQEALTGANEADTGGAAAPEPAMPGRPRFGGAARPSSARRRRAGKALERHPILDAVRPPVCALAPRRSTITPFSPSTCSRTTWRCTQGESILRQTQRQRSASRFSLCAPLVVLFLPFVLAPGSVRAQGQPQRKPLLAVLEFDNHLGDSQENRDNRAYLTDLVRNRSNDLLPWLDLITRENIVALLAGQGKTLEDCQKEGECEVQTGERLGADYVISGALLRVGGELRLSMKLHDTHTKGQLKGLTVAGKDVKELEARLPGKVEELLAPLLESGTSSVKGPAARATSGELFLSVSPPGATYELDGSSTRSLSKAGTALVTLPLGKHRVLLRRPGYQDAAREVLVQAGAPFTLKETLLAPSPPRAANSGKGYLVVDSEPNQARIFLDGRDTGEATPANFRDLTPGKHEVVLKRNLYLDYREPCELRDDETVTKVLKLVPDFGDLVIESEPPGASITLDDRLQAEKTPARLRQVPSGAHRIELSLARHDGAHKVLVVQAGDSSPWRAELQPAFARITVNSEPQGATVFVDDNEEGETPRTLELDRGRYRIRLRRRLYAEYAEIMTVQAGKNETISRKLSARFGSLHVIALAAGQPVADAEVLVQGRLRGKAPITVDELPEEVVTVEVRASLHRGFTTEVNIVPGPPHEVRAVLSPEYGFLAARTDQRVTVEVDGRVQGRAGDKGFNVFRLPIGLRKVVLRPEAPARYRFIERDLQVAPLETERMDERLLPRMGRLVVLSTPLGAALTVDGREQGQTPTPKALELFAGPARLEMKKERYLDWTGTALVKEGETESVTAVMKGVDSVAYEASQRAWAAHQRGLLWGLVGALVLGGASVSEYRAHKYASDESSALGLYSTSVDPTVLATAGVAATSAASSAKKAQNVALLLVGVAAIPLALAVWNLVSAP
jgi:TolB-like protein